MLKQKKDKYPIPSILDFTSDLHGAKIFSPIDLVKAFQQIPIASEDIHETAICTPFGLFESTRMQFGLCKAASTFQRFIDEVTRGLKGVYAFIDDILIASQNVQEHTTNLCALFERLDYYGLTIKPSKCTSGIDSLKFLGFQVSSEGISPLPNGVDAIQKFPRPNTLTQLQGQTNKKKPSRPSKNPQTPLEWTEEVENSFTAAKTALADATLLKHPILGATLSVWTDASNFPIGSSLMQLSNSNWEPIAFLSLKLSRTLQNWSTYDRELLAIYTSIKTFRHLLEGREFNIYVTGKV
ncbi:hypothetical protein TNCV_1216951 [Trichonephila clavipes]|nr:hypothetical protein TNCV_1216951 [Trichonephila clavipes]